MPSSKPAARSPVRCRGCAPSARPSPSCGARSPKPFGKPDMLQIGFRGWFQCRLATDPDPYDEPRGVSGYVYAYVDEPDLARGITFQPPRFSRDHGPGIGVAVHRVVVNSVQDDKHPLLGLAVDLLDEPKFE